MSNPLMRPWPDSSDRFTESTLTVVPVISGPTRSTPALINTSRYITAAARAMPMSTTMTAPIFSSIFMSRLLSDIFAQDLQIRALQAHDRLAVLNDAFPDHGDGLFQRELRDLEHFVMAEVLLAWNEPCPLVDMDDL